MSVTPIRKWMIEEDIIKSFKFLNLDSNDFEFFFRNKKESWRYLNENVQSFMLARYQANSLKTFNNSKNFDEEVAKHIFASSPLNFQQLAIPNEEFIRLKKKFENLKIKNFNEPDIIVISKLKPITKKIIIKEENYNKVYDGKIYILYLKKIS